jgi:hypothetical protein
MNSTSPYRIAVRGVLLLFAAAGSVGLLLALYHFPPTENSLYPRCQLHSVTGLHCPGCGTTRALHAAMHGQVAQAFAYNALAFAVVPVVGLALVRSLWAWFRDRPGPSAHAASRWTLVLFVALLVYGVLRNIPCDPFTILAPHELSP